jgi:hypothetical protein
VVVADGITGADPEIATDPNPGEMVTWVAPEVVQVSILDCPEFTEVGLAEKDVITGEVPWPGEPTGTLSVTLIF